MGPDIVWRGGVKEGCPEEMMFKLRSKGKEGVNQADGFGIGRALHAEEIARGAGLPWKAV